MGGVWEIGYRVVSVSNEQYSFSKLGSTIVDRIHLEAIHVVCGSGHILKVFRKQPNHGAGLLVRGKGWAAILRAHCDRAVAEGGREEAPHVLHEEKPWLKGFDKPQELPQKRTAWILGSSPLSCGAKRLARRPAD